MWNPLTFLCLYSCNFSSILLSLLALSLVGFSKSYLELEELLTGKITSLLTRGLTHFTELSDIQIVIRVCRKCAWNPYWHAVMQVVENLGHNCLMQIIETILNVARGTFRLSDCFGFSIDCHFNWRNCSLSCLTVRSRHRSSKTSCGSLLHQWRPSEPNK